MINLSVPQQAEPQLKPCITVVGVGGAGGNAVNNMIADSLQGVEFIVANTDAQALSFARTDRRVQLGQSTTAGLGAGAKPEVGRAAAEETYEQIAQEIDGANMVFITAGMGGGTGTGAAPVIARVAREMGILTVGVVTKPFQFEGQHRMRLAEAGIEDLSQYVDTLIIIPNQNLFRVANEKTTFADAFKMADDVLNAGVRSITDLMIMPGLINLDFADVRTVMSDMGRAMMGTGEASGERRALDAAEAAIANPLLEDTCMKGAGGVLINITGGPDITLFEVDEAANRIRDEVEGEAHILFGSCFDPELEGKMRVSVVATGISGAVTVLPRPQETTAPQAVSEAPAPQAAPAPVGHTARHPATRQTTATQRVPLDDTGRTVATGPQTRGDDTPETVAEAEAMPFRQEIAATGTDGLTRHPQATSTETGHHPHAYEARRPATEHRSPEPPRQTSLDVDLPQPREGAFIPRPAANRGTPLRDMPQRPSLFSGQQSQTRTRPALATSQPAPSAPEKVRAEHKGGFLKGLAAKLTGETEAPRAETRPHTEPTVSSPATRPDPRTAHPEDHIAPSRQGEEDELEIPAFLRRQAN